MNNWTNLQKIIFRFGGVYIFIYAISNQFLPAYVVDKLWQKVVPWFASTLLNPPKNITIFTNGSGDTTYNYVSILVYLIVALIATIIWTILDRKSKHHNDLLQWMIVLIRYYLIYQMIIYGLAKIFYLQFQPASFSKLVQNYGDSSPMGLLWTFMGHSKGYTMFTGFGELIGGLLLLFRRTTTLGALVVFAVMSNVMALNYFYDVPVKLLSSHMVLMALILIVSDSKRLINLFFKNTATQPRIYAPYFKSIKMNSALQLIKWLLIISGFGYYTHQTYELTKVWGVNAEKPKLYGLYEVETFVRNSDTIPPLMTDKTRWREMIVERQDQAMVNTMTNRGLRYSFKPDSLESFVRIHAIGDTTHVDSLYYSMPDSTTFLLEGVFMRDTLHILFTKKDKDDFLLRSRGFRWINETPFNR